ncbi:Thiol-disulfide isomerase or thioredoxin [Sinomicrobium oceani]|uniref:Thiol-disulfide isomerase or thioredoxin n=1 Tax=Sinomicrobium oceani TaxID=1150368 RepID=A0A1K1R3D0_9FLAO|nr:TlpA disulfide reductase family protein [Sinomicrobium oceani]SFW66444.1 Thiol-disulfide isomerase or thioredoxin [Sinomicrobium oceani]
MKKIVIFLISLLCSATIYAQKMNVLGDILASADSLAIFFYQHTDGSYQYDTVPVTQGRFTWEADIPEYQKILTTFLPSRKFLDFISENSTIYLTGRANALEVDIYGSGAEKEATLFGLEMQDLTLNIIQKWNAYSTASKTQQSAIKKEIDELNTKKSEQTAAYIREHPDSGMAANLVYQMARTEDYNTVFPLFSALSETTRKSTTGKLIAEKLEKTRKYALQASIFNFSQKDPDGNIISYEDFRGKYLLVDFWASWCAPCRAENPNILKVYNTYKDKGFEVVGISLDTDAIKWVKAIKEDHLPWPQLSDLKGYQNEIAVYYDIYAIPYSLLVSPEGKIIAKGLRGEALNKKLSELFD